VLDIAQAERLTYPSKDAFVASFQGVSDSGRCPPEALVDMIALARTFAHERDVDGALALVAYLHA